MEINGRLAIRSQTVIDYRIDEVAKFLNNPLNTKAYD